MVIQTLRMAGECELAVQDWGKSNKDSAKEEKSAVRLSRRSDWRGDVHCCLLYKAPNLYQTQGNEAFRLAKRDSRKSLVTVAVEKSEDEGIIEDMNLGDYHFETSIKSVSSRSILRW